MSAGKDERAVAGASGQGWAGEHPDKVRQSGLRSVPRTCAVYAVEDPTTSVASTRPSPLRGVAGSPRAAENRALSGAVCRAGRYRRYDFARNAVGRPAPVALPRVSKDALTAPADCRRAEFHPGRGVAVAGRDAASAYTQSAFSRLAPAFAWPKPAERGFASGILTT